MKMRIRAGATLIFAFLMVAPAGAWDEKGHVIVTELAIDDLPAGFPAWMRTAESRGRLCYLCAEPDRWRGQKSLVLDHINGPDHYLDVDDLALYGLTLETLPRFRNEFIERLAAMRAERPIEDMLTKLYDPERAATSMPSGAIDSAADKDHTKTIPGLLPYAIEELRWKITSSWSTLRTFEEYRDVASEAELAGARDDVLEWMGLISHFVGDAAQPLHLTRHHHGWVGPNPKGYTTEHGFHSYIDGGVIELHRVNTASLRQRMKPPTRFDPQDDWLQIAAMLHTTVERVEPLYALEKSGELRQSAGKEFIENCLLDGGANLAGIWIAAYQGSQIDEYLAKKLAARRHGNHASAGQPTTQPAS